MLSHPTPPQALHTINHMFKSATNVITSHRHPKFCEASTMCSIATNNITPTPTPPRKYAFGHRVAIPRRQQKIKSKGGSFLSRPGSQRLRRWPSKGDSTHRCSPLCKSVFRAQRFQPWRQHKTVVDFENKKKIAPKKDVIKKS